MSEQFGAQLGGADIPDNPIPALIGPPPTEPPPPPDYDLPHEEVMSATLMRIEHELRRLRFATPQLGRQQTREDAGQTSAAGAITFTFEGPRSGADWYVERIAVSVAGASAAAIVAAYQGSGATASGFDETMLIDFLGSLTAGPPARGVMARNFPYFVYGGQPLVVAITGAVALQATAVRFQMREVLGNLDTMLQNQPGH